MSLGCSFGTGSQLLCSTHRTRKPFTRYLAAEQIGAHTVVRVVDVVVVVVVDPPVVVDVARIIVVVAGGTKAPICFTAVTPYGSRKTGAVSLFLPPFAVGFYPPGGQTDAFIQHGRKNFILLRRYAAALTRRHRESVGHFEMCQCPVLKVFPFAARFVAVDFLLVGKYKILERVACRIYKPPR